MKMEVSPFKMMDAEFQLISIQKQKFQLFVFIYTVLHAGGKFKEGAYQISGGLHGVGASVVNALSEYLEVETYHNGKVYYDKYKKASIYADLR